MSVCAGVCTTSIFRDNDDDFSKYYLDNQMVILKEWYCSFLRMYLLLLSAEAMCLEHQVLRSVNPASLPVLQFRFLCATTFHTPLRRNTFDRHRCISNIVTITTIRRIIY